MPRFSCVVDRVPGMAYSAWLWALTLMELGGQSPNNIVVHFVDGCASSLQTHLEAMDVETLSIARVNLRHPPSNKLAQLKTASLAGAEVAVLCDCDLAFGQNPLPWLAGSKIRARQADAPALNITEWRRLLHKAGFNNSLPKNSDLAPTLIGELTLPGYCNGGLLILPQQIFAEVSESWPRWNNWILDRLELLGQKAYFADQVSFTLACIEAGHVVDPLPPSLNLPIHLPKLLQKLQDEIDPVVLHVHNALNGQGELRHVNVPAVDHRIDEINAVIARAQRDDPLARSLASEMKRPSWRQILRRKWRQQRVARRMK